MHLEHRGLLYALGAAVALSISSVFVKLVVEVPLETMLFARFFIAFLFLIPSIALKHVHLHIKYIPKHILRGLMGLISIGFFFYSVTHLPLVNAVTLSNTTPLFMPIVIFLWLKLIIPKARICALVIGFLGVVVILQPLHLSSDLANYIGLLGALAASFALVGVRQLSKTENTATILTYYYLISLVILVIPMIVTWEPIHDPMNWLYLVLIGISSALYQFMLTRSLTYCPTTKVGSLTYLSVLFSGLLGWWIFKEVPNLWIIGGTLLIITGGVIALLSKDPARQRSP